ncbi:MAG: HD domain-containing protein [Armatimonadota bacterium]
MEPEGSGGVVEMERKWGRQAPEEIDWMRWALESDRPGELLLELQRSGEIRRYPELAALVDVPQEPQWHPEGPVHLHTAHVLNAAAAIAEREGLESETRAVLLFSALTHDLGKPSTTVRRTRDGRARWTSYGHDRVGVPIAARLLRRLGISERIIQRVQPLVAEHMAYYAFKDPQAGVRTARKLAQRVAPATLRELLYLIEADHSGRPPLPPQLPPAAQRLRDLAERAGVLDGLPHEPRDAPFELR